MNHPGIELQLLIKEKGLTQKAFASILGKKVSEVNELLKGKRNITIQWDYLLHQSLGTPIKYWILKQVDYDYSLISPSFGTEGEESRETGHSVDSSVTSLPQNDNNDVILSDSLSSGAGGIYSASGESTQHHDHHSEQSEESINNNTSFGASARPAELCENPEISPLDKGDTFTMLAGAKPMGFGQPQETPIQDSKLEDDEDLKNRANIFRSF